MGNGVFFRNWNLFFIALIAFFGILSSAISDANSHGLLLRIDSGSMRLMQETRLKRGQSLDLVASFENPLWQSMTAGHVQALLILRPVDGIVIPRNGLVVEPVSESSSQSTGALRVRIDLVPSNRLIEVPFSFEPHGIRGSAVLTELQIFGNQLSRDQAALAFALDQNGGIRQQSVQDTNEAQRTRLRTDPVEARRILGSDLVLPYNPDRVEQGRVASRHIELPGGRR